MVFDRGKFVDVNGQVYFLRSHGGEGSGNFGHAGRPGEIGGSSSGGGADYSRHTNFPRNVAQVEAKFNDAVKDANDHFETEKFWVNSIESKGEDFIIGADYTEEEPKSVDINKSRSEVIKNIDDSGDQILEILNDDSYGENTDLQEEDLADAQNQLNYWLAVSKSQVQAKYNSALHSKEVNKDRTKSEKIKRRTTSTKRGRVGVSGRSFSFQDSFGNFYYVL